MIPNIDYNKGILHKRLSKFGLAENTILIYMTDNGTSAGAKFKGLNSEALAATTPGCVGKSHLFMTVVIAFRFLSIGRQTV